MTPCFGSLVLPCQEALLRIVEDLHQTCKAAGMTNAGRHSIKDSHIFGALCFIVIRWVF